MAAWMGADEADAAGKMNGGQQGELGPARWMRLEVSEGRRGGG
jgi:hypothetical protein